MRTTRMNAGIVDHLAPRLHYRRVQMSCSPSAVLDLGVGGYYSPDGVYSNSNDDDLNLYN